MGLWRYSGFLCLLAGAVAFVNALNLFTEKGSLLHHIGEDS